MRADAGHRRGGADIEAAAVDPAYPGADRPCAQVVNRLAGIVVATLLVAVGLLVVAETVLFLADRPPWLLPLESWRDSLSSTELADRAVLATAIVMLVAGLGLLILQLRRFTPSRLRAAPPTGAGPTLSDGTDPKSHADWWLQRRSVERRTAAAAQSVWGVHDARSHARDRHGWWGLTVSGAAQAGEESTAEVEAVVRRELDRLSVTGEVPVTVSLKHSRRVV